MYVGRVKVIGIPVIWATKEAARCQTGLRIRQLQNMWRNLPVSGQPLKQPSVTFGKNLCNLFGVRFHLVCSFTTVSLIVIEREHLCIFNSISVH